MLSVDNRMVHEFVSVNCEVVPSGSIKVDVHSAAHLYGKGIFSTFSLSEGVPFVWDKHWRRLNDNATKIALDLSEFSEGSARKTIKDLVEANAIRDGRARITFFDESATALWPYEAKSRTSMLVMTADFKPAAENFKLTLSPHLINSTSPLAGVKSCNYLEKIIAKDEAKQRGFDEAIQPNERGEVTSACMANVFWLKDGKLFTPSLATGCLPGTTREHILENIDCVEVESGIEELRSADDMFLTSAGIGVVQVAEFEGRKLQRNEHAIMKLVPSRQ